MKKVLFLSVAAAAVLSFSGCGNNKEQTKTEAKVEQKAGNTTVEKKDIATKAAEAANSVKEKATKAVEATKEAATKAAEVAKEKATKAVEATKEAATKVTASAKAAVSGGDKGKALYAKCAGCHGANGKVKALGKSEVIAGQKADELAQKIRDYKAGKRNVAGMGALMSGQVKAMSDEDIKALANYISNLK